MQHSSSIRRTAGLALYFGILTAALSGCGGGGGSSPPRTAHIVTISWDANREAAVNSAGGGYKVGISGQGTPIDVPYASGVWAAPMMTTTLMSGNYSVTVTAYSALNAPGSTTGSTSVPSAKFKFSVPY